MRRHMVFGLFCMVLAAGVLVASSDTELTIAVRIPTQLLRKPFSVQQDIPVGDSEAHMQVDAAVNMKAGDMPPGVPTYAQLDDLSDLPQQDTSKGSFLTTFLKKHPYLSFGGVASLVWCLLASFDPEVRAMAKNTVKKAYKKVCSSARRAYRSMS